MERRWCVREDIFDGQNALWWLRKELESENVKSTPMTVALRNIGFDPIINVRFSGLEALGRRYWQ